MHNLLGFVAGLLTTASLVPQLLKSFRSGCTRDVSLAMLICLIVGMALWLAHGVVTGDPSLITANGVSLALAVPLLGMKIKNDLK